VFFKQSFGDFCKINYTGGLASSFEKISLRSLLRFSLRVHFCVSSVHLCNLNGVAAKKLFELC
jgi:hypothetical protein